MTGPEQTRNHVRAMLAGQEDASDLDLEVVASGGAPSERYSCALRVSGSGPVHGRVLDELAGRDQPFERDLAGPERDALLRDLAATGLLDRPRAHPPFIPDSVVVRFTARSSEGPVQEWYALLDDDQPQGLVPSEPGAPEAPLQALVDLIDRSVLST